MSVASKVIKVINSISDDDNKASMMTIITGKSQPIMHVEGGAWVFKDGSAIILTVDNKYKAGRA